LAIVILFTKLFAAVLQIFGRGSSLPGEIALKIAPNILKKLKLPATVIAVTGSNGKTGTCELISAMARDEGKRVICNSKGSNLKSGVATLLLCNSTLSGKVKADVAVIESDERYCQYTFADITPNYIVITNLFRDQLTRNGHNEFVAGELAKGLPAESTLILCADDPLVMSLGMDRNIITYGIDAPELREKQGTEHVYNDGVFCPVCHRRTEYRFRIHNHVGSYRCPSCGFDRGTPNHVITRAADDKFTIDGEFELHPQIFNTMFGYNDLAAFTAGVDALGIKPDDAVRFLDGYILKNGRIRSFGVAGHKGTFMLCKHENSISYDRTLQSIVDNLNGEATVVLVFDQLSRKYTANDISWLWDIDFDLLADDRIKRVLLSGEFADDLATRFEFTSVDPERLTVIPKIKKMMKSLYGNPVGEVFVMTCFTDVDKFISGLRRHDR